MQVENITRVGLSTGGTTQDQRDLPIGYGLFGEVVINHQRIPTGIAEILPDSCAGKRSEILHGGRIGSGGTDHDGVIHRSVLP